LLPATLRCVVGSIDPDVLKDRSALQLGLLGPEDEGTAACL